MTEKYICQTCKYETTIASNFKKHELSKKHINNTPKRLRRLSCKYCKKIFAHQSSLSRHENYNCEAKTDDNENPELLSKMMNCMDKMIDLSTINAKSTRKSMNMLSYANKHYTKAPPVKLLEHKEAVKLLTYDKHPKYSLGEMVVFKYKSNQLSKFLGNMIVAYYKQDKPEDQSIWSTDTSRLSFILMHMFTDTNKKEWNTDKKGIRITKIIIEPILNEVRSELIKCKQQWFESGKNKDNLNYMELICFAEEILIKISTGEISQGILQYIAPNFDINLAQSEKVIKAKCCKCDKLSKNGCSVKNKYYCDECLDKLLN